MPRNLSNRLIAATLAIVHLWVFCPAPIFAVDSEDAGMLMLPSAAQMVTAAEGGVVRLETAEIEIPPGALEKDTEIRITRLWRTEDTGDSMRNATAGGGGYRFEPAGTTFKIPATIRIGYDPELTDSAKETLYTYFFNTGTKQWEQLERSGLEGYSVVSITTHFTDMINGTLSLPEGPTPLSFNINSIKGLEAANPSAGVPGIEGLEGNNTGAASFRIPIEIPPGRAGMAPQVSVTYSSDGGNGIMGRGFDLQAGGRIATDTRWGVPLFNGISGRTGKIENTDHLTRDTYMLDGVKLEYQNTIGDVISYEVLRETRYDKIERVIRDGSGECDYWVVTDRQGTRRTYGKNYGSWSGKDKDHKFVWELEEERDVFGNTIEYKYDGGTEQLFLKEIIYTGNINTEGMAAYTVAFEYSGRDDIRVDGRGGYAGRTDRLLTEIKVLYLRQMVRRYKMEYVPNMFGALQMTRFGQTLPEDDDVYLWSYRFEYERMNNEEILFDDPKQWGGIRNGLQVQSGVSGGAQGSISTGSGAAFSEGLDVRINGGGTLSHGDSQTMTGQTFIDLNGDGRPDSVRISSSGLEVLENTGNGFRSARIVSGTKPSLIGKETSTNTSYGWNIGTGAALYLFGLGISYAETTQTGWGDSEVGFADVDGDGRIDVITSGSNSYYRNISDSSGIKFEIGYYSTLNGIVLPANSVPPLDDNERDAYDEAYYQETPLREWRAPYKGKINISQSVRAANNSSLSRDGIFARTYYREKTRPPIEMFLQRGAIAANSTERFLPIEAEESLYFLGDALDDTRGDDIVWDISITYEEMQYFADMDRRIRYVPPVNKRMGINEYKENILAPLYKEVYKTEKDQDGKETSVLTHYELSGTYWERLFNFGDENRDLKRQVWEEIVRLGWFVPGYISAENFEALWEKAEETDTAGNNDENRHALIMYYLYHAGNNAYIMNADVAKGESDELKELERKVNALIQMVQMDDSGYYDKLAGYWLVEEGRQTLVYPIPNRADPDGMFVKMNGIEAITDRRRGTSGYIYLTGEGRKRLVIDIIDGKELSVDISTDIEFEITDKITTDENVDPPEVTRETILNVNATDLFNGSSEEIPYYIDGKQAGMAILGKETGGRKTITIPEIYDDTLCYEQVYEFTDLNWISSTLSLQDIEALRVSEHGEQYTTGGERWQNGITYDELQAIMEFCEDNELGLFFNAFSRLGHNDEIENTESAPLPADGEYAYILRTNLNNEETDVVNRTLDAYGWHIFMTRDFPFYAEAEDGMFILKSEYSNVNINQDTLDSMFRYERQKYSMYKKLIESSFKFGFTHYAGNLNREIYYYAGGMYKIENGGITILILEKDENDKYIFTKIPLQRQRVSWNSGRDYTNEKREPHSYKLTFNSAEINFDELGGILSNEDIEKIKNMNDEDNEVTVAFANEELLPGGINRWYYAIWLGSQDERKSPFDRDKLKLNKDSIPDMDGISQKSGKIYDENATKDEMSKVYYMPFNVITGKEEIEIENNTLIGTISRRIKNEIENDMTVKKTVDVDFPYLRGNLIHTSRAGGASYYEIPGMPLAGSNDRGGMPNIRQSRNNGTDRSYTFSADLHIPTGEIDYSEYYDKLNKGIEKLDEITGNKTSKDFSAGVNYSINTGGSYMYQSVQDIDGNGIADIIQTDGNSLKVTSASRSGFDNVYTIEGISEISRNGSTVETVGGTVGFGGASKVTYNATGKVKGVESNGGGKSGNGSLATGTNGQKAGFIDMNGDGLPDYFNGGSIKMNLGRGRLEGELLSEFHANSLNTGSSLTVGTSKSFGTGFGNPDNEGDNNSKSKVSMGISGGLNYSVSMMETESMLMDMNGDGLPDVIRYVTENIMGPDTVDMETGEIVKGQVIAIRHYYEISYNLGDRFGKPHKFNIPGWDLDIWNKAAFSSLTDGNLFLDVFKEVPLLGNIVDLLHLDDLFKNDLVINPFGGDISKYLNQLETNQNISIGLSVSTNVGITIEIPIPSTSIKIIMNIGGGGGFNVGANIGGVDMRMTDMDGDGLPDRVLRIPGTDYLLVQRNLSGRVGLLRKISLPQGGEYSLDYEWKQGTVNMPQSRYVLSQVTTRDNSGTGGLINPAYASEHEYRMRYSYADGNYDRNEKEFYGFRLVTTESVDSYGRTLGRTESEYFNDRYYLRGMARQVTTYDGNGNWLRRTEYAEDIRPYARYTEERRETRETVQEGTGVYSRTRYDYDIYGNVTRLEETASGSETITAEIRYWHNDRAYLHAHPSEITVRGSQSGLLRKRVGTYYENTGALWELTQLRGESRTSGDGTSVLEWDSFGNLKRITDPGGAYVGYQYDRELSQYVITITAGGNGISSPYESNIEWDKALGKKIKETDENRNSIDYVYDRYGRLIEVWSPYDRYREGGITPAVRYRYEMPERGNWYAVTENKIQFDSANSDVLSTVVMIDGLGRALYTAKQGEVWNNGRNARGWNVSGFTSYDSKGRSVMTGQPLFVDILDADDLARWTLRDRQLMVNPTEQEYDSLDRVVRTVLPAAPGHERPVQTTRYTIRNGTAFAITTDPLGNISEQGSDGKGNILSMRRLDKYGSELTSASYLYNGLGEMLEALDADNNPLTVEYDRLGRRVKMTSADIGTKEWQYDASGNVTAEWDSVLVSQGKRIQYSYDGMNRLVRINYPNSEPTLYEYGEYRRGGRDDNAAGRVTRVTDETGTTSYKYGLLGQVTEEERIIKLLPLSGGRVKTAVMSYLSDYLGRMQEIIYPDDEVVRYGYNYGGQITSVTGRRKGTDFLYVKDIGYDEYGQRVYIEYGSGIKSYYTYDPYRRWLETIRTESQTMGNALQNMKYEFDLVGNVKNYENRAGMHTTRQDYSYDGLYQLTRAHGQSSYHPYGSNVEYRTDYTQTFAFSSIGNMTNKTSEVNVNPLDKIGHDLNYTLDYAYYPGTHKAERIGDRYYDYDRNGNVIAERDGGHAVNAEVYRPYYQDGDLYWTEYGFGLVRPEGTRQEDGVYQRNYRWNERNLLSESSDSMYTVQYRYGADGQRALKYVANSGRTTAYFNKMWQMSDANADWLQSKHIYLGEDRIATKYNSEGNSNTQAELERTYYYHSDHLGSAQIVTNYRGQIHERLEYTPYGELWIDWQSGNAPDGDVTPFRFTGKESDPETGLYYYGARYLDPKTGRWISGDPALGEYIPQAGMNNKKLPNGGIYNAISFHVYNYSNNNPIKYVDPDGETPSPGISIKDFYKYTMGDEIASRIANVRIVYGPTPGNRGGSMPWNTIYIPINDRYQGGYNPTPLIGGTETGRIGQEAHEMWHQIQYQTKFAAFERLTIEQGRYELGKKTGSGYDPYILGDPVNNLGILNTVRTLSDIPTLEGQAQFIGQWNADVYQYLNGGYGNIYQDRLLMYRLKKEALIIIRSGINSPAAQDIINFGWNSC